MTMAATHGLLLPDPEPRTVTHTVVSVDDHVVEPPHAFEGRLPAAFADRAPKVVTLDDGAEVWEFDGNRFSQIGLNAFAGRDIESASREPMTFSEMRPGCYDIHQRIADMDLNGVWASLNFPSQIAGFCGRTFAFASDRDLGIAAMRAWNDWLHEEWYQAYPDRIIPSGLTFLTDPEVAAAEIRRNAERGFRSVSLPERPHRIGLPSIHDDYWDPILSACAETQTVVSLHVGSTGMLDLAPGGPGAEMDATLFTGMSMIACSEWLWSPYPRRYPDLKIALSEGGIGWVAMLVERLGKIDVRYSSDWNESPRDVLRRNFWFCTIDEKIALQTRKEIGVENILLEVDYPHIDGTWPNTQLVVADMLEGLTIEEQRAICSGNAADLFRFPLPDVILPELP